MSFARTTFLIALSASVPVALDAAAQSGSGSRADGSGSSAYGSGSGSAAAGSSGSGARSADPALDGFCAVCLVEDREWVRGKPEFEVAFDGRLYRFPNRERMARFQADPAKYAPALGGDDIVEFARTGKRVAGSPNFGATRDGMVYLFANDANKRAFTAGANQYASADLALGGDCVVCKVDMNERRAGDPKINAVNDGLRFFFAGANQQQQFLANVDRYTPAAEPGSGSRGSGSAMRGSGSGSGSGGR